MNGELIQLVEDENLKNTIRGLVLNRLKVPFADKDGLAQEIRVKIADLTGKDYDESFIKQMMDEIVDDQIRRTQDI